MTTPDTVGGLPELPDPTYMVVTLQSDGDCTVHVGEVAGEDYYTADQMRAYGELCRAAPDGGDAPWRCFHCDEVLTTGEAAALHFGTREYQSPACQIDVAAYREMEALQLRYLDEDADVHRSMYRMQSEHKQALRRAEEDGYAKGVRDAAQDSAPAGSGEVLTADAATLIRAKIHEWRTDALEIRESDHAHRNLIAEEYEAHADELEVLLAKKASPINGGAMVTDAMVAAAYDHLCGAGVIEDAGTVADDMKIMRAALEAALLRKLQQGADYVVVPRVPTEEMLCAGRDANANAEREAHESNEGFKRFGLRKDRVAHTYRAMIAASQDQEGGHAAVAVL